MKKEKIFVVHLYNDFSGSPKVLRDAILCLTETGHSVHLFTSKHKGFLSNIPCSRTLVHYSRFEYKALILLSYIFNQILLFFILGYQLSISKIKREKVSVLINTVMPVSGILVCKLLSVPITTYMHEVSVNPPVLFDFLKLIVVKCSDRILCVSNFMVEYLNLQNNNKIRIISNSLGKESLNKNYTLDLKYKFNRRTALFVGSLKDFKGIFEFLELARMNPNVNFVAAFNCEVDEYEKFIKVAHPKNFKSYRRPRDLGKLYSDAMFIMNLSDPKRCKETFGLTLIEGLSFGCIAIAPPVGGPAEIVTHDVGLIASSHELKKISEFLDEIVNSRSLFDEYSKSAMLLSEKYSFEEYREKINYFVTW